VQHKGEKEILKLHASPQKPEREADTPKPDLDQGSTWPCPPTYACRLPATSIWEEISTSSESKVMDKKIHEQEFGLSEMPVCF
jgi:hypothetical protein